MSSARRSPTRPVARVTPEYCPQAVRASFFGSPVEEGLGGDRAGIAMAQLASATRLGGPGGRGGSRRTGNRVVAAPPAATGGLRRTPRPCGTRRSSRCARGVASCPRPHRSLLSPASEPPPGGDPRRFYPKNVNEADNAGVRGVTAGRPRAAGWSFCLPRRRRRQDVSGPRRGSPRRQRSASSSR